MRPPAKGPAADEMRGFFFRYGAFLQIWQTFELMIEIAIMRQLRLSEEETSILCSGLNYSTKASILVALLKRDPTKAQAMQAVRKAQQHAERNDFVHAFLVHAGELGDMKLVRRTVKNGNYDVDLRPVTDTGMKQHVDQFTNAFLEALQGLGIAEEDIDAYSTAIESHGQSA
jgi:hypothetical protein